MSPQGAFRTQTFRGALAQPAGPRGASTGGEPRLRLRKCWSRKNRRCPRRGIRLGAPGQTLGTTGTSPQGVNVCYCIIQGFWPVSLKIDENEEIISGMSVSL